MAVSKLATIALIANLTVTEDSTGQVMVNRGTGNPSVDSTSALFMDQFITSTAGVNTNLPYTLPVDIVYIKNIDASAIIKVTWTPVGSPEVLVCFLQPGGQILFFNGVTGQYVTNVKVSSSVGTTAVEFLQGVI